MIKFDDLVTKIGYVYKNDVFVIKNKYLLGGPISEDKNIGSMICELSEESIEGLLEKLGDKAIDFYKIKEIKKIKKDFNGNYEDTILPTTKELMLGRKKKFTSLINDVTNWTPLTLSDEEKDRFFNQGLSISLPSNNGVDLELRTSMFPMLKEDNLSDLYYDINYDEELTMVITKFTIPHFTIYTVLSYLNC